MKNTEAYKLLFTKRYEFHNVGQTDRQIVANLKRQVGLISKMA